MQGMNMVAGSILYHTDSWVAFHVLVHLFDTLQMRDIYMSGEYIIKSNRPTWILKTCLDN